MPEGVQDQLQTASLIPSLPYSFNDDLLILSTYSAPCIVLGTGNRTASKTLAHREFAFCCGKTDSKLVDLCKMMLSAGRNIKDTKGVPSVRGDLHIYARSRGSLCYVAI